MDKNREMLTREQIRSDIVNRLYEESKTTKSEWNITRVISFIVAITFCVVCFFVPHVAVLLLLLAFAVVIISMFVGGAVRRHRARQISMDDYDITTDVVSHTELERYYQSGAKIHRGRTVFIFNVHFESGRSWQANNVNYDWSEKHRILDFNLYENVHRGDVFVVVVNRKNGKIVMAYSEEWFEYKPEK